MTIETCIVKHVGDQIRIKIISQLINSISRVFQKLFRYLQGILILTFSVPSFPVVPAIFVKHLNEALLILSAGKSAIAPSVSKCDLFPWVLP